MNLIKKYKEVNKKEKEKAKLEELENNYTLVSLVDCCDRDKVLGAVYLNKKHSIQDFQNAIYQAKDKRADEINEYGDDWSFISEELEDFDYFEVNSYDTNNWVEY